MDEAFRIFINLVQSFSILFCIAATLHGYNVITSDYHMVERQNSQVQKCVELLKLLQGRRGLNDGRSLYLSH